MQSTPDRRDSLLLTAIIAVVVLTSMAVHARGEHGRDTPPAKAGVASPSFSPEPRDPGHNSADEAFAMAMTEHHIQAIQMTNLVPSRTSSNAIKQLAAKIAAVQSPQIDTMANWMDAWGTSGDMASLERRMPGAMSAGDLRTLAKSTGTAFDLTFLHMMMEHHIGAIAMARTELTSGRSKKARALASLIARTQEVEVDEMRAMLGMPLYLWIAIQTI